MFLFQLLYPTSWNCCSSLFEKVNLMRIFLHQTSKNLSLITTEKIDEQVLHYSSPFTEWYHTCVDLSLKAILFPKTSPPQKANNCSSTMMLCTPHDYCAFYHRLLYWAQTSLVLLNFHPHLCIFFEKIDLIINTCSSLAQFSLELFYYY